MRNIFFTSLLLIMCLLSLSSCNELNKNKGKFSVIFLRPTYHAYPARHIDYFKEYFEKSEYTIKTVIEGQDIPAVKLTISTDYLARYAIEYKDLAKMIKSENENLLRLEEGLDRSFYFYFNDPEKMNEAAGFVESLLNREIKKIDTMSIKVKDIALVDYTFKENPSLYNGNECYKLIVHYDKKAFKKVLLHIEELPLTEDIIITFDDDN